MSEISRSQTLRENERIKHFAGALTAWANSLVVGGFGAMAVAENFEIGPIAGILLGFMMLWISSIVLTMLQADGEI